MKRREAKRIARKIVGSVLEELLCEGSSWNIKGRNVVPQNLNTGKYGEFTDVEHEIITEEIQALCLRLIGRYCQW